MKDLQKSRALQACRLLIAAYDEAWDPRYKERKFSVDWHELEPAVKAALEAAQINGRRRGP